MTDRAEVQGEAGLPAELARPTEHMELNQSRWWEQALERLVSVTLWLGGPLTPAGVSERLEEALGTGHLQGRVDDVLERLLASGAVFEVSDDSYKVSEEHARSSGGTRSSDRGQRAGFYCVEPNLR